MASVDEFIKSIPTKADIEKQISECTSAAKAARAVAKDWDRKKSLLNRVLQMQMVASSSKPKVTRKPRTPKTQAQDVLTDLPETAVGSNVSDTSTQGDVGDDLIPSDVQDSVRGIFDDAA